MKVQVIIVNKVVDGGDIMVGMNVIGWLSDVTVSKK